MIVLLLTCLMMIGALIALYYSPMIQKKLYPIHQAEYVYGYAEQFGLDPYLVAAVIKVESKFRIDAESGSGARGLMQVMPETAKWVAEQLEVDFRSEMLFDSQYNIMIGCWYLSDLMDKFDNDLIISLAAYNAGRGNVRKWLQEKVWDGTESNLSQIPFPETRNYVKKVLTNYNRYRKIYSNKQVP